ncbi:MAG: ion transporter [Pseudomonadota bacterium]
MDDREAQSNLLERPIPSGIIAALIVFSAVCFALETLPNVRPTTLQFLHYSEVLVVAVFTIEYLYRIFSAPSKRRFIFSFYGLVDLIAILPFYLATALDLRSLRLLRLLRVLRLLKLARYHKAFNRLARAIRLAREELVIFSLATLVFIYLAAVGIYYFEHPVQPEVYRSVFDSLWWAVTSLTTVGYGDMYPVTVGGRIFTFLVLMLGLGLVAMPAGIIASSLNATRLKAEDPSSTGEPTSEQPPKR